MEPAFHSHDILAPEFAEYQFACMSFDRRNREVGDVAILKFVGLSYL